MSGRQKSGMKGARASEVSSAAAVPGDVERREIKCDRPSSGTSKRKRPKANSLVSGRTEQGNNSSIFIERLWSEAPRRNETGLGSKTLESER